MKEEIWNELYLIRIEIGVFKNFKECARSPCNGNHFSSTYIICTCVCVCVCVWVCDLCMCVVCFVVCAFENGSLFFLF